VAKVLVVNHVTLDGVMQAPARADEDTRDGFERGGWAIPRSDALIPTTIGERMGDERAFLFGRRTYEDFHNVWSRRGGDPFADAFAKARKYVASRTLREPLPWVNSVLLSGEATHAVAELRRREEGAIVVFGSGELARSLAADALVDEYLLMIHPVVLGRGRRLFAGAEDAELRLTACVTTRTGVILASYVPDR
jgi:dihydrofolate reductase